MTRRPPTPITALLWVSWVVLAGCASAGRTFVVYHTSDVHGGIEPRPAKWFVQNPLRAIGGQATLGALVAKEERPKLLLDSGDIFQGTPIGNLTKGTAVVAGMNALGYTAMAIGNHEYDFGEMNLERLSAIAQFPFLAVNIRRKETGERPSYAKPSVVVDAGGVKIGILGVATHHTATATLPQNVAHLLFESEVEGAKREADRLRRNGAEVVIALSHCGLAPSQARKRIAAAALTLTAADEAYGGDLAIARGSGVDLVLGGHLHTGIAGAWRDPVSGKVIVQSYEGLEAVSRVVIRVDESGAIEVTQELVDLWVDEIGADAAVAAIVADYAGRIGTELDVVVGAALGDLRRADGGLDSALGNAISDAMRRAVEGAEVAIQNTHGIRADLYAGNITVRDIYRVLPFENTLTVVDVPGAVLQTLVEESLKDARARLQFSGLAATVTLAENGTTLSVSVGVGNAALDPKRVYRVVTNNYLTSGGGGGEAFAGLAVQDTGRSLRDVFIADLKARTPLTPPATGRLLLLKLEDAEEDPLQVTPEP